MERGREKRLPDGTPQRSGGSIDPECRRPPARNTLFYSFAAQSPFSLFSRFYPLSPSSLFSTGSPLSPRISFFPYFVSLFPPFVSVLAYSAPFLLHPFFFLDLTIFLVTPSHYVPFSYLINYLFFLAFINFNLLFFKFLISLLSLLFISVFLYSSY